MGAADHITEKLEQQNKDSRAPNYPYLGRTEIAAYRTESLTGVAARARDTCDSVRATHAAAVVLLHGRGRGTRR